MSREFFNRKAKMWDQMVDHDPNKIRRVIQMLPNKQKQLRILDVGSGTGVLIPFLKEHFGLDTEITAIDFAEKMLQVSKKKHQHYSNLMMITADILTYPLPEDYFDYIICYSVFPHFTDKKEVLQRLQQPLKPGGGLIIFHSQSREAINKLHAEAGKEVQEDRLPKALEIGELARELGYGVGKLVDDEEMYVVQINLDKL